MVHKGFKKNFSNHSCLFQPGKIQNDISKICFGRKRSKFSILYNHRWAKFSFKLDRINFLQFSLLNWHVFKINVILINQTSHEIKYPEDKEIISCLPNMEDWKSTISTVVIVIFKDMKSNLQDIWLLSFQHGIPPTTVIVI